MQVFQPIPLNLPPAPLKLFRENGKVFVLDILRKKKLICTPEEWVRQHWIHYLIQHKNYPKGLISSENGLILNGLQKRSDLLVHDKSGEKFILAEFKRPSVKISQITYDQIAQYNSIYKIPYLIISNGIDHHLFKIDFEEESFSRIEELPLMPI